MNKKFFSTMISLAMVTSMVPMAVYAADTENLDDIDSSETEITIDGNELEGTVDTKVFCVDVPTDAYVKSTLQFIMDPEMLISKTTNIEDKYTDDETFEENKTLFFKNSADDAEFTYSSVSDSLVITNKSSVAVDVSVSASLSNFEGITLTDDSTFSNDTNASIYLAIADGTNTVAVTGTEEENVATVKAVIDGNTDAYEYVYDAEADEYTYVMKGSSDLTDITFDTYEFNLTGATNTNGDWSELVDAAPEISLVWNFALNEGDTAASVYEYEMTAYNNSPELHTAAEIDTITVGGEELVTSKYTYTVADGVATFKLKTSTFKTLAADGTPIIITFADGSVAKITLVAS
ncbi:MAG: hypothetical protein J6A58_12260 [Oscillospiraceae bacterium]|nr:hypothetical protein [Oscillospiraceae bacterium]